MGAAGEIGPSRRLTLLAAIVSAKEASTHHPAIQIIGVGS
jgi:hypothetical protein